MIYNESSLTYHKKDLNAQIKIEIRFKDLDQISKFIVKQKVVEISLKRNNLLSFKQ
jgi:hypothetical protein